MQACIHTQHSPVAFIQSAVDSGNILHGRSTTPKLKHKELTQNLSDLGGKPWIALRSGNNLFPLVVVGMLVGMLLFSSGFTRASSTGIG